MSFGGPLMGVDFQEAPRISYPTCGISPKQSALDGGGVAELYCQSRFPCIDDCTHLADR